MKISGSGQIEQKQMAIASEVCGSYEKIESIDLSLNSLSASGF